MSKDDLLTQLRDLDPVDERGFDTADFDRQVDAARGRLGTEPLERTRAPRRQRRIALVPAFGIAVVAAAVIGIFGLSPAQPTSAQRALAAAADVARSGSTPTTSLYARLVRGELVTTAGRPPYSAFVPVVEEVWIRADGSARVRSTQGEPDFAGPRDRARWERDGRPAVVGTVAAETHEYSAGRYPGPAEPALPPTVNLPADVDELERILRAAAATGSASVPETVKVFEYVGAILQQPGASPQLRAALYELASSLPDVELLGEQRDRLGRRGQAVAMTSDYSGIPTQVVIIFDPRTSRVLAQETRLLVPAEFIDGRVIDYRLLTERKDG